MKSRLIGAAIAPSFLLLSFGVVSSVQGASLTTQIGLNLDTGQYQNNLLYYDSGYHSLAKTVTGSVTASGWSKGESTFGALDAETSGTVTGDTSSGVVGANDGASAQSSDTFTITSPGVSQGTVAYMNAIFSVSLDFPSKEYNPIPGVSGFSDAIGSVDLTAGNGYTFGGTYETFASSTGTSTVNFGLSGVDLSGMHALSIPFYIGESNPLDISIHTTAQISGSNGAWSAWLQTYWGGIQSITVDGQTVPFSMISGSGTDYTIAMTPLVPTPIPASVYLFGTGLVGLVGVARRSKRRT